MAEKKPPAADKLDVFPERLEWESAIRDELRDEVVNVVRVDLEKVFVALRDELATLKRDAAHDMSASSAMISSTVDAFQLSSKAVDTAIEEVRRNNATLEQRINNDWKLPRAIFAVMTAVVGVVFSVNLYQQYMATNGLRDHAKQLQSALDRSYSEADKARTAASDATSAAKNATTATATLPVKLDRIESSLTRTVALQVKPLHERIRNQEETIRGIRTSLNVANAVFTDIHHGRDHLVYRENPSQAIDYLNRAEASLESLIADAKTNEASSAVAEDLRPAVAVLRGEIAIAANRPAWLRTAGQQLFEADCDCLEAHFFEGMASLHDSLISSRGRESFLESNELAIRHLDHFRTRNTSRNPALIYLAAANASALNFTSAKEAAEMFLRDFSPAQEKRLLGVSQIRVIIAKHFLKLSQAALGDEQALTGFTPVTPGGCIIFRIGNYDHLSELETKLLVASLDVALRERAEIDTIPDADKERFAELALSILVEIMEAGCQNESKTALRRKYKLPPFPTVNTETKEPSAKPEEDPFVKPQPVEEKET